MEIEKEDQAGGADHDHCLCLNFMPYRMTSKKEGTKYGVLFGVGCMMCGRFVEAETPKETMLKWNKECAVEGTSHNANK